MGASIEIVCSMNPGRFGLGRFGQILGWVVSAYVGGSIRPWVVSALGRFGQSLYQNVD